MVAIQTLSDTTFATLKDNDYQEQKAFFTSQNSQQVLDSIEQFSAGFILFGNFQQIEINEGTVVLFCL